MGIESFSLWWEYADLINEAGLVQENALLLAENRIANKPFDIKGVEKGIGAGV